MAKIYGINNDIVGRLGNEVFERQGDANIVRGYNPHHSGTPSQAQLIQKARLDCMGNWERRLPLQAVEAFRGNKSQKWAAFVRKNMPLIIAQLSADGGIVAKVDVTRLLANPSDLILGGEDEGMKIRSMGLVLNKESEFSDWSFGYGRIVMEAPCLARFIIMGIALNGDANKVLFRYKDEIHYNTGFRVTWFSPFPKVDVTQFIWLYSVIQINIVSLENFTKSNNWVQPSMFSAGDRTTLLSNVTFCKGKLTVGKYME